MNQNPVVSQDTDRLNKAEYAEYQERMQSLIAHNLVACYDDAGRRCWQLKDSGSWISRLEEFHLEAMVAVMDNRPR